MKGKIKFCSNYYDEIFEKNSFDTEETIKLLIKTLDSGSDSKRSYNTIYQILYNQKDPALIMKYFSYVESFGEQITLINLLSDDEKVKYFDLCGINDYELIIDSFKDDELKIKYLPRLLDEYEKYNIVLTLKTDENKISCLDLFESETLKANIVGSFHEQHKILDILPTFSTYYQKYIIDNVLSEKLKKEYFNQCSDYIRFYIMGSIKDDNFKYQNLELFKLSDQIAILLTFTNEPLLLSILKKPQYYQHITKFLDMITDSHFVEVYFDNCVELKQKLQIINKVNNMDIKRRLIMKLDDTFFQSALVSNFQDHNMALLTDQNVEKIKFNIDEQITFGVELEICIDKYDKNSVLLLKKMLNNWKIKADASLGNGVEIVSPVLTFSKKDMQALKYICDFFSQNDFYTDERCGGHIHFGFNYFTTIDELNIFLNLYGNVEDILYLISNRCGSKIRPKVHKYAGKLKPELEKIAALDNVWQSYNELAKYVLLIKGKISDRYFGLNLLNMNSEIKNTIEFRMPNGEINFQEIILNIRLFAKMMENAKIINQLLNDQTKTSDDIKKIVLYKKLISVELDDREKVKCFLNILFNDLDERKLYYKRYFNNSRINQNQNKNEKKVLCLKKHS